MSASTEDDMQPKNDEEADLVELLASMRSLARAMGVEALRRTIRDMPGPVVVGADPQTARALAKEIEDARRMLDAYLRAIELGEIPPPEGGDDRA